MAIRQTTSKRRRKAPKLTKAQADNNFNKWFRENQERLGLDPIVLTRPGWASDRTEWPEYPPNPPKMKWRRTLDIPAPARSSRLRRTSRKPKKHGGVAAAAAAAAAAADRHLRIVMEMQQIADEYDGQRGHRAAAATGEPLVTGLPKRFAGQLTETFGGCWKWHGEHRPGKGIFAPRPICGGEFVYRLLFVALRGPVPPGKQLHHRCYRGWCANPWHTEPLTNDEHLEKHTPSLAWLRAAGLSF